MYQRILAPLDGSELSECSLRHVRAVATGCNVSEVVLLRVVEPLSSYEVSGYLQGGPTGARFLTEVEKESRANAEKYLAEQAEKLNKEGINTRAVLVEGKPADVILDFAQNNQVDLIVMSTHGRSGVSRWAFGSVADRVVRSSVVPVLLISPPGCRIA